MMQEEIAKYGQIMMNQPGKPPVPMSIQQVAELLTKQGDLLEKQGEQIKNYEKRIVELESMNRNLQKLILEKSFSEKKPDEKKPATLNELMNVKPVEPSKSEPLFKLDASML
jgi:hypothetical protein